MAYRNHTMDEDEFEYYIFEKNLQGDIVAVYDTSGTKLVSYTYDAWGTPLTPTGTLADTVGAVNPFRYKSYYYDSETRLYYLRSRSYDPAVGRFLNADSTDYLGATGTVLSFNLFAYCENNPVEFSDMNGTSLLMSCILIGAGIGSLIGVIIGDRVARRKGYTINSGWDYLKYVMGYAAVGGALGGLAGWAFSGTSIAASMSWSYYKLTNYIASSSYAIGRAFEKWFYEAYNVVDQQVRYFGYRFDAIYNNTIVELKNYDWSKYNSYSGLINRFTSQAKNYLQFIGQTINGQTIRGVTFCFSSKPPQEIIDALQRLGVTVNWI